MTVHETRRNKTRRVETRRDEKGREEQRRPQTRLLVGLRLACIPTEHKYCPQTHNFVGLRPTRKVEGCTWVGVGSKRSSSKPTIYWVSSSISQIRRPAGHGPNPQFTEFGARFGHLSKKATCYPRRMCKVPEAARCKLENST